MALKWTLGSAQQRCGSTLPRGKNIGLWVRWSPPTLEAKYLGLVGSPWCQLSSTAITGGQKEHKCLISLNPGDSLMQRGQCKQGSAPQQMQ